MRTLENLRRALAAIVFALSACAPNEARQAVDPAALPPAARLVALFESVVFRDEYDPKREIERVRKLARPIRISLEGAGPAAFAAAVAEDAGELARLTGLDIRLLPQPDPAAEIRIRFVAWDDMEKEAAEFAPRPDWLGVIVEASACLFIFRRNERWEITRARILVSARERAEHKRRCLLEELTQALGLPNDSELVQPSIFNERDNLARLALADRIMVRTLYDPRIAPGMPRNEAMAAARDIVARLSAEIRRSGAVALERR